MNAPVPNVSRHSPECETHCPNILAWTSPTTAVIGIGAPTCDLRTSLIKREKECPYQIDSDRICRTARTSVWSREEDPCWFRCFGRATATNAPGKDRTDRWNWRTTRPWRALCRRSTSRSPTSRCNRTTTDFSPRVSSARACVRTATTVWRRSSACEILSSTTSTCERFERADKSLWRSHESFSRSTTSSSTSPGDSSASRSREWCSNKFRRFRDPKEWPNFSGWKFLNSWCRWRWAAPLSRSSLASRRRASTRIVPARIQRHGLREKGSFALFDNWKELRTIWRRDEHGWTRCRCRSTGCGTE